MAMRVTCSAEDCAEHGPVGDFYQLTLRQPYSDFDDIVRFFCEEHIHDFGELLPNTTYVHPDEVSG